MSETYQRETYELEIGERIIPYITSTVFTAEDIVRIRAAIKSGDWAGKIISTGGWWIIPLWYRKEKDII